MRSLKGDSRAPDVLDVSPSFAIAGANEGLYAKYFNNYFGSVPRAMKDGRGFWVGDYWGVISFGVNRAVVSNVPKSWNDLLKPEYKNKVALNGSPLTSGSAFAGVFSAALANGGSLTNIGPGIDYFKRLKDAGNFIPVQATPQTIASGQTPITIDWDYLNLAYIKEFPAAKIARDDSDHAASTGRTTARRSTRPGRTRTRPASGRSSSTPTQGQLLWLKGYSHPARFADMARRKVVPASLLEGAPFGVALREREVRRAWSADEGQGRGHARTGRRRSGRSALETADRVRRCPAAGASRPRASSLAWLGVVPFFAYAPSSCFLPAGQVLFGAFKGVDGGFTLSNIQELKNEPYISAYKNSIEVSLVTAVVGGLLGFLIAYSAIRDGTPRVVRSTLTTFSGVAANFAGIPLAFAFIATLGTIGIVTQWLINLGFNPYDHGFSLFSKTGRRDHVSLLPDSADDPGDLAGDRRPSARVARGIGEPRSDLLPVLALRRRAGADALAARRDGAALRQLLLRLRHGLRPHRRRRQPRAASDRLQPERERARQSAHRRGPRLRDDRRSRGDDAGLHPPAADLVPVGAMRKRISPSAVLWLGIGALYFLLPLLAMLIFSLRSGTTGKCCTSANYREIVDDPEFWRSLRQSFVLSIETIIVSLALLIPTVYWVHLKLPRLRP